MKYKITVDQDACIGCGACTTCDNFEIGEDGKAKPVKEIVDDANCSRQGEEICPVQAIKITEE